MRGPITFLVLFAVYTCFGQNTLLDQTFHKYQEITIDVDSVIDLISTNKSLHKEVSIGQWALSLSDSQLLGINYRYINSKDGAQTIRSNVPMTMNGTTSDGGQASITIAKDFIMGYIQEGGETYYIEPISHFLKISSLGSFIIYNTKDIKKSAPSKCAYDSYQKMYTKDKATLTSKQKNNDLCYEIEYFVASDNSMFDKYGALGLEARNIAILNDVNTNFQNEFENEIRIILNGQYVSNCESCDPWSPSLDFTTVLNSFRAWGNTTIGYTGSALFTSYDIASLWSDRWDNSVVVGQAYLDGVCTDDRYNLLSDFSPTSSALRVLVAHEIGHNLNAFHDASGSGTIMSPSINITNSWSASSINAINNTITNSTCLEFCSDLPATVFWDSPVLTVKELSSSMNEDVCNANFVDYAVSIRISKPPSDNVHVLISANSGLASSGVDFDILTSSIVFSASGDARQDIFIRVYDDAVVELLEDFELRYDIVSGPANESNNQSFSINIISEDELVTNLISPGDTFYYGEPDQLTSSNGFFEGSRTDVKTRFLISSDRLISMGLKAGNIDMLSLFVLEKKSTGSFQNFRIGMTATDSDQLSNVSWLGTTTVFQADINTLLSWNNFDFSTAYYWNGTSNIYVELCFDNSAIVGEDKIVLFKTEGNLGQLYSYSSNELDQCGSVTSQGWTNNRSPVLQLRQKLVKLVEDYAINSAQTYLKVGEYAVFYSERNRLIASLENIGSTDLECVQVSVRSEGIGRNSLDIANGRASDKSFRVQTDSDGAYRLTIYYNENEASIWGPDISDLKCILSETPITNVHADSSEIKNFISYQRIPDVDSAHAFSVESSGPKYIALTDWEGPSSGTASVTSKLYESGLVLEANGGGILLTSVSNEQYALRLNSLGSILFFKNAFIMPSASLESGDLFIDSSTKALHIAAAVNMFVGIFVDEAGNLARTPPSPLSLQNIKIGSGYLKLSEPGAGIVFRNLSNICYKLYVNAEGVLSTDIVTCQ